MKLDSTPVEQLKNIGPTIAKRLQHIGIRTRGELAKLGPVTAYLRLCAQHPSTTMPLCYYLYSLEGALRNQHWDALNARTKLTLRQSVEALGRPKQDPM